MRQKKILVVGATGLIGSYLVEALVQCGLHVNYLSTQPKKIKHKGQVKGFYWQPSENVVDENAFHDISAIINLAGATVNKRWTPAYKKKMYTSRVNATRVLYNATKLYLEQPPQTNTLQITQYISASGISIYPSSFSKKYTEDATISINLSFLGTLTQEWETAAQQFQKLGMRTATVRTGIVLAPNGGAYLPLRKLVKSGLASPLGSGMQWQSWIHISDIVKMYLHILFHDLEGAFNAAAPQAVTQTELLKQIGMVLSKKIVMPKVPALVLRTVLGERASMVLESQNVSSKKIENSGFSFQFPSLFNALQDLENDGRE